MRRDTGEKKAVSWEDLGTTVKDMLKQVQVS